MTDPPYGIREPTFKVGTTKDNVVIAEEHLKHHIPQKVGAATFSEVETRVVKFTLFFLTD